MVVRYVTSVAALDVSRRVGEAVPDRLALAVFVPGAFDLIGGRRGSPEKAIREAASPGRGDFRSTEPGLLPIPVVVPNIPTTAAPPIIARVASR